MRMLRPVGGVRVEVGAFLCYTVANEKVMQFSTDRKLSSSKSRCEFTEGKERFVERMWRIA